MRAHLAAILVAVAALAGPAAAHATPVPAGFFGVVADGPLLGADADLGAELELMREAGVQSLRATFSWRAVQPYAAPADVPASRRARFARTVGGVPTDFAGLDRLVVAAARRGIGVLPVVLDAPRWAAGTHGTLASPPRDPRTYGRLLAALVRRYGPRGALWRERPSVPRRPIRTWQVWNEPDLVRYWPDVPWARGYVRLLKAAHAAVKRADPGARVLLAGLTNFAWRDLAEIYRAGGRGRFDGVAVQLFTRDPANVVRGARIVREVMRRNGDAVLPLLLTEVAWTSAAGRRLGNRLGIETSERGQAVRLRAAFEQIARARAALGIDAVYWASWLSPPLGSDASFDYAGLRRLANGRAVDKPALDAFRAVVRRLAPRD